jgi:hypothetical protein
LVGVGTPSCRSSGVFQVPSQQITSLAISPPEDFSEEREPSCGRRDWNFP